MTNPAITEMLNSYSCRSDQDYINALREIMQSVALLALSRNDFFNHAAFYGETALRILYGLNRGSEDMDFSLLAPDANFSLGKFGDALETEFASFGLRATFSKKIKMTAGNIQSAFLKSNTHVQLLSIGLDAALAGRVNARSEIKIKLEVDVQPPSGFDTEIKYLYQPLPFAIRSYTLPDLLAGKLHAVLFRSWKSRVKGRDWYDLVWYAGKHPQYHLSHLEQRARQSADYTDPRPLTELDVQAMLERRLAGLDIEAMKADVRPFLRDQRELEIWSKDFFTDVFRRMKAV
ncbi:MAG: nucleotidyl transferase AbiEii/AbiGii toxin family protein [Victivallales bacterium]|jgi:predicted nucleotidyltransferase component of viral defense system|nr:nucleotidyl transferase AbiEii/AbiGii toxin family protein [Victivallales bacterium]